MSGFPTLPIPFQTCFLCLQELDVPHKSMIEMIARQYLEKAAVKSSTTDSQLRRHSSTSDEPRPATSAAAFSRNHTAAADDQDDEVFKSGSKYLKIPHKLPDKGTNVFSFGSCVGGAILRACGFERLRKLKGADTHCKS